MKKKLVLLIAVLFVFTLVAGALYALTVSDDKAKSAATVQKDDCCKKGAAECKDKAACKDQNCCKDKAGCAGQKAGECPAHKEKAPCAPKEGSCPDTCPAKSACEKK